MTHTHTHTLCVYAYVCVYVYILKKKILLQMAYWFFLGRAGRFGSKFPDGEVTCMNVKDLPLLHSSLKSLSPVLEVIAQSKK